MEIAAFQRRKIEDITPSAVILQKNHGKRSLRKLSSLRFTVYGLRFTVYSLRFTVYSLQFIVYSLQI